MRNLVSRSINHCVTLKLPNLAKPESLHLGKKKWGTWLLDSLTASYFCDAVIPQHGIEQGCFQNLPSEPRRCYYAKKEKIDYLGLFFLYILLWILY